MTGAVGARGFTLVELIVVLLILAILGSVIGPRLARRTQRAGEQELEAVADALRHAGSRHALSSDRVALSYDGGTGVLSVWVHDREAAGNQWRIDPLAPLARLEQSRLESASAGSMELDPQEWWHELQRGVTPLALALVLTSQSGAATRLELSSFTGAVRRSGVGEASEDVVDLDAQGLGEEPW